jgi:hypothetical protein
VDSLTLAAILDALAKLGALGAAGITIWALVTERIVPKGRVDELRAVSKERLAEERAARMEAIEVAKGLATQVDRMATAAEAQNRLLDGVLGQLDRASRSDRP